jgi:uncharacterized OsmC-like protein
VAAKKRIAIRDERVRVSAHFHEQGSVLRGDAEGFADGLEVEIALESDASPEQVRELVRLTHQMCFTEKALSGGMHISTRHMLNGVPLEG